MFIPSSTEENCAKVILKFLMGFSEEVTSISKSYHNNLIAKVESNMALALELSVATKQIQSEFSI